ncbi:MAG: hypothetical protein US31_C0020G0002 [Berkelbacteria bacterium GW2011_GWA1_36_9]|uniref:Uncharacterized protein n=1 Tax=Berkelbacteria bacterium GW2011_GWA1_36_9 TaxID=1618331 RepID=A0A0G0FHD5_9BACT|nr:MAG: hypothetical protein US31_C0020G0002 [Berkelbacteria bacterium GW2011_GWA1_36_9]
MIEIDKADVRVQVPELRVRVAKLVLDMRFGLADGIGVPLNDRECLGLTKESAYDRFGYAGMGIVQKPLVKKIFGLSKRQSLPEILLGKLLFCANSEHTELSLLIDIYGLDNESKMQALAEMLAMELNIPFSWRIMSEQSKEVTQLGQSDM